MADQENNVNQGCLLLGLLFLGGIIALAVLTSRDAGKYGPSDDPYYDAPVGRDERGTY